MRRELQVHGTWNSDYSVWGDDDDWHRTIGGMQSGVIRLNPLISHRVGLDKAFDALRMMRESRELYCKVLIYPESGGATMLMKAAILHDADRLTLKRSRYPKSTQTPR